MASRCGSRQKFQKSDFLCFTLLIISLVRLIMLLRTIILIIPATAVFSRENHLTKFIISQALSWCDYHPFGVIYSDNKSYNCFVYRGKSEKLKNTLENVKLRVGIIPNKVDYDYDCHGVYRNDGLQSRGSYSHHVLRSLQNYLKFDVQFVAAETWGSKDPTTKNWTGLVRLIKDDLVDLTICHTTITKDRSEVVDFLFSTLYSSRSLIYQPSHLPLTQDVFVLTFSQTLWLCFSVALVLLVICFRFSTWTHSRIRPDHEPWSWVEVILWADAAVCQQSYSRHPKGSSCRTMFLIGYLITYLLYTGFAAGVTSLLAVQGYGTHLKFSDVVIMKLKLILQSDGTHFEFLKNSPDPFAKSLYENLMHLLQKHKVENLEEMFAKLEEENFVGLGSTVTIVNYVRRKIHPRKAMDFTISRIPFTARYKAFLIQKNSPYKEILNYWLLRLKEAGLLDVGKKRFVHIEERSCCELPGWSSAGLGNVLSSIIILTGGWFFSVLILFFEMAWKRKSSSNEWEIQSKREVFKEVKKRHDKSKANKMPEYRLLR